MNDWPVILFDGECTLCNRSVSLILRHERVPWCRFASLQTEVGQGLVRQAGADPNLLDTVYVWTGGRLLERSDAALFIVRNLCWPWRALVVFRVLPRGFRDRVYDVVARNRYRWFGRIPQCAWGESRHAGRFIL